MPIHHRSVVGLGSLWFGLLGAACSASPGPADSNGRDSEQSPGVVGVSRSALGTSALFTTGVDATGTAVTPTNGTLTDLHYQLVATTDPSVTATLPVAAYVVAPNNNTTGSWAANSNTAQWISAFANTRAGGQARTYTYRTTFTLSAGVDPTKLVLTGTWACDDECTLVLNGAASPIATNPGASSSGRAAAFSIAEGSLTAPSSGTTYTLDFVVNNSGGYETGLLVSALSAGCTLDSQCQTTEFCDTQHGPCTPKLGLGISIPTSRP